MPSGVGGFLTGMMSEQERLRTAAADQQKVGRERFDAAWRQAGEIEAEINSPTYTPDRIPALIEKARVWDSAYRDQLGMSMVASLRSRLNLPEGESSKSPSIKFEGAGTAPSKSAAVIAQIKQMASGGQNANPSFIGPPSPAASAPAPVAAAPSMAGWPSAQRRDDAALAGLQTGQKAVAAVQDAAYATTQLRTAYDDAISSLPGGYSNPQAELAVLRVSAQAEPLLGPANVKSTEGVYLDTIKQMRSERMASEARTQANIDKGMISESEFRLRAEALNKYVGELMGDTINPLTGQIESSMQGTGIMRMALQNAGYEMIGMGLAPHEVNSRILQMFGNENGVVPQVADARPKPWRQQMAGAPMAWQNAADSFYAAGNSPAQYAPSWNGNSMEMVDLQTGDVLALKVRSQAGVPQSLDAGNYVDPSAAPAAAAPAAPAAPDGPPNPFERVVGSIGDATSKSLRGVGIGAESVIDLFNRRAGK